MLHINKLKPFLNAFKLPVTLKHGYQQKELSRSLWYMCSSQSNNKFKNGLICSKHSDLCSCGCGKHQVHSEGKL